VKNKRLSFSEHRLKLNINNKILRDKNKLATYKIELNNEKPSHSSEKLEI